MTARDHDSAPPLISVQNLHLRRGGRELFGGLDLTLNPGQIVWVRGANGSGKTTLLRICAGLQYLDAGRLLWRGQPFGQRLDEPTQAIVYLGERPGLSRDLSVRENLRYHAALAQTAESRVELALADFDLEGLANQLVRSLSTGQAKRSSLARLRLAGATIWLLDEPFNGLDADNRLRLGLLIAEHVAAGGSVLIASHENFEITGHRLIERELQPCTP